MKCPNCGETIYTKHNFCVVCGANYATGAKKAKGKSKGILQHIHANTRAKQRQPEVSNAPMPTNNVAPGNRSLIMPDFMQHYV